MEGLNERTNIARNTHRGLGVKLNNHSPTPTPGRRKRPPTHLPPLPPLQRPVAALHPSRRLCKGGSGVVRSGDPCGRPGVWYRPATDET
jgi:hypothetical protein